MKKLKNNKGVAFVTVLIAITFISILAVSLLYIAYLNYLTKSLRTRSNDNFYTGEFGVDEVAASLQQTAANVKSSGGGIKEAKEAIAKSVGSSVGETGTGTYDPSKVTGLVKVVNSDPNSTVVVTSDDPVYIAKSYSVELKNLRFDTTDANGFTSTIYTDMTVQFQSTPPGDYDINDFSVISDSIISVEGTGQGSCNYSGCVYIKDTEDLKYALKNDKGTLISLLCPVGIIDGNLVIENAPSAVSIAGDVMVNGDVIVDDGCSLAVSGSLKISGDLKDSSNANIVGRSNIQTGVDMSALPKEGMASHLFAKHLYGFSGYNNTVWLYDYAETPLSKLSITNDKTVYKNLTYEEGGKKYTYPVVYATKGGGKTQIATTEALNEQPIDTQEKNKYYKAQLNLDDITYNGGDAVLVMSHKNIKYLNNVRNSTMLTLGKIIAENNQEVSMTKMSKAGYQAAIGSLWTYSSYSTKDDGTYGFAEFNCDSCHYDFQGGDWKDFCEAICSGDWVVFDYNPEAADSISEKPLIGYETSSTEKEKNIKKMQEIVYEVDDKGNVLDVDGGIAESTGKEKAIKLKPDDATRYLVFKSDGGTTNKEWKSKSHSGDHKITCMIPYGYFLGVNTSHTVSSYVSATSTAENPDLTTVRYDNWYKE